MKIKYLVSGVVLLATCFPIKVNSQSSRFTIDVQEAVGEKSRFWNAAGSDHLFYHVPRPSGQALLKRMQATQSHLYLRSHHTFKKDTNHGVPRGQDVYSEDEYGNPRTKGKFASVQMDDNIISHRIASPYQADSTTIRVLMPDEMIPGESYRVLYVLPVIENDNRRFGDGLSEIMKYEYHNGFKLICVAPEFTSLPCYADHATNLQQQDESHFLKTVVPFIDDHYPTLKERGNELGERERLFYYNTEGKRGPGGVEIHSLMVKLGIPHRYLFEEKRIHRWDSGWIPEAVRFLVEE